MKILVVGAEGASTLCAGPSTAARSSRRSTAPRATRHRRGRGLHPDRAGDIVEIADLAGKLHVDLTVIGPELPLSLGIVDEFVKRGLPIFGPTRLAAQIESSKVFAKEFFRRHNIPTAEAAICSSAEQARKAIKEYGFPVVLKADGLAGGKGVLIVESDEDAERALRLFFQERVFGAAGDRIVVEEFLRGQESSFLALFDGEVCVPLPTARDYKKVYDGDRGPEHRRNGSALARGRAERRDGVAGPEGHPVADVPRSPGRGPLVPRRPLCRPHGHRRRPEGPRVQRAFRGSGDGGHPAARDVRHGRRAPRRLARRARPVPPARGQE
jgi:phosphoribosylamine--glycine ligase